MVDPFEYLYQFWSDVKVGLFKIGSIRRYSIGGMGNSIESNYESGSTREDYDQNPCSASER